MGPNVKKLIIQKMSKDAVPDNGGFEDAVSFLTTPEKLSAGWRTAEAWVKEAIAVVRTAAEPNPYKTMKDESIAEVLLKSIEEKRRRN